MLLINNQKLIIEANEMFYIPSGLKFCLSRGKNTSVIIVCFDFYQDNSDKENLLYAFSARKLSENKILEKIDFTDYPDLNNYIIIKDVPYLKRIFIDLSTDYFNKGALFREKCSGNLKVLISTMARKHNENINFYDRRVNDILSYIDSHYGEKINNDSICRIIGYHPYYLNNLTKEETGNTIHWHLMHKRISAAKQLLTHTQLSVSEIALRCGFASQTHFSNTFRKYIGKSPNIYRKENQYNFENNLL